MDLFHIAEALIQEASYPYAEVRVQINDQEFIWLRNGELEAYGTGSMGGISARVLVDGGLGFASTSSEKKAKQIMELAAKNSRAASRKGKVSLSEERFERAEFRVPTVRDPWDVPTEEKIELLKSIDSIAREEGIVARSIMMNISKEITYFLNNEGASVRGEIPRISISMMLTHVSGQNSTQEFESKGGSGGFEIINSWRLEDFMKEISKSMKERLEKGVPAPKGKMDVVIGPPISGLVAHESTGHPYEADRVLGREAAQAGESFVTRDMLGTRIGSELVSVADDPTIEGSYGFYLYDFEGVKARRRILMKNGIINEFLHNRETASIFGIKSNGAARASDFNREPIVRMSNTFIMPGDSRVDELIEDVSEGVYIKRFMEWNIDDRRYNQRYVGSEAYMIRGGRIAEIVLKPVLEVTTPSFYSSVDGVGKDLEFQAATCGKGDPAQGVPVWTGGPTIRLRGVGLGGI
ncbi:MAG: TldD/PmbA family protein [Thermoproteota archaeon]|uniref:TldD/PmbA family protein n=1 Tax=Candidatus Methanodesulfokora washburnensis TaxID=2478471 RepID=A0A3R9PKI6_9CREN|nr:TldD/PmbA family protein [Candidatus Methanodesulfokores washburnensis]RSN75938.1 TldD/PmbA family protein [Candidatus Methanodesulfokores washburnensis]RZN62466.1 MAG: TldD/PmbA family protein [Candidatus Methanodesulfokores washburnensis]TDA39310.1 MAG: TldD/PmbA family protein [Candidatus Korarchaeota archaeon]